MAQFKVLNKDSGEVTYTDTINPKIHLHVVGGEFSKEQLDSIKAQYGAAAVSRKTSVDSTSDDTSVEETPDATK